MKKFFNNHYIISIISSIIACVLFSFIIFLVQNYNIVPQINEMNKTIKNINSNIIALKENYLIKDIDGTEVYVSINNEMKGNAVSVFKDNSLGLKYSDAFFLKNPIDQYCPTIRLVVVQEVERDSKSKTNAEIFISMEASKLLNLTEYLA